MSTTSVNSSEGRALISTGSSYESHIGYSRALVCRPFIFVSGTTGFDYATMSISPSISAQADQAFSTISETLSKAGSSMKDVVRVRYILPNKKDFGEECWEVCRKWLGDVRPAATMWEAGLLDDKMKIEIEVTAMTQGGVADGEIRSTYAGAGAL